MTHEAVTDAPSTAEAPEDEPLSAARLIGLDLARGLAVFGMYAVHVGPDPGRGGVVGFLMELASGRSSALFAVLAGFAVALITGRRTPKTGRAGRQAVAKVVIRAVILMALGSALTMTGTPVVPILAFYGVFFLLVLPLYRLGAKSLAVIAAGWAMVGPQLLYALKPVVGGRRFPTAGEADGIVSLLFTGGYPALTWVPFVIAGLAVARLDLTATTARARLALTGIGLAVTGYGGSWLALRLVPGAAQAVRESAAAPGMSGGGPGIPGAEAAMSSPPPGADGVFGGTPAGLLVASPHSETTLSIVGNTGVAITVLAVCLAAMDAFPRLRRLALPIIAVGSMSLTAYVGHIVAIWLLGIDGLGVQAVYILLGFIVSAAVLATAWSRFFPRGPLESLMGRATRIAQRIR